MKFEIDNLNTKGYFVSKFTNDLSNLENPNLSFDRNQWAYNLAYTQWTREEMEEGKAWSHLL